MAEEFAKSRENVSYSRVLTKSELSEVGLNAKGFDLIIDEVLVDSAQEGVEKPSLAFKETLPEVS